jgi:hypothetical protein
LNAARISLSKLLRPGRGAVRNMASRKLQQSLKRARGARGSKASGKAQESEGMGRLSSWERLSISWITIARERCKVRNLYHCRVLTGRNAGAAEGSTERALDREKQYEHLRLSTNLASATRGARSSVVTNWPNDGNLYVKCGEKESGVKGIEEAIPEALSKIRLTPDLLIQLSRDRAGYTLEMKEDATATLWTGKRFKVGKLALKLDAYRQCEAVKFEVFSTGP